MKNYKLMMKKLLGTAILASLTPLSFAWAAMPTLIPAANSQRPLPVTTTTRVSNGCITSAGIGKSSSGEFVPMWILKIRSVEVTATQVRIVGIDNVYAPAADNWARTRSAKPVAISFPVNPLNAGEKIAVTECINSARIAMASGIGFSISGNFNMLTPPSNWEPCYANGIAGTDGLTLSGCALDSNALAEKNSATGF